MLPWNSNPLYIAVRDTISIDSKSKERTERTDSVLSIGRSLVDDTTGSLGRSVGESLNVGSNNRSSSSEEILQILPSNVERELHHHLVS